MGVTAPRGSACILPVHFIQFQEKPNYFLQPAPCSCISLFYMHTSTGFSITGTQGQGEGNRFVLTWENGPEPVVSWASGKAQCTRGVLLLKKWDLIQKFAKECKTLDLPQSICMPFLQQVTERCWFRQFIGWGHNAAFSCAAAVWWMSEEAAGLLVLAFGTKCSWVKAEDPLVLWQLRTVRMIWGTVWF